MRILVQKVLRSFASSLRVVAIGSCMVGWKVVEVDDQFVYEDSDEDFREGSAVESIGG